MNAAVGLPLIGHRIEVKDLAREKAIEEAPGDKRDPLWCILVREFNQRCEVPVGSGRFKPVWELKHIYRHSECEATARMDYVQSVCTFEGVPYFPFDIVGIARPIGVIALDDHGDVCKL
jgi:hypothetical protein